MTLKNKIFDAVVIGGGFYGCTIASWLAEHKQWSVLILERESELLTRASFNNQARVHNGYHYPRDFVTANRSRINLPLFVRDYPDAVFDSFQKVYGVASQLSKITPRQFERFCESIGADLKPVSKEVAKLFNSTLIPNVWEAKEFAFNADKLRIRAWIELKARGVSVITGCSVSEVVGSGTHCSVLTTDGQSFEAATLFNCTYSGTNQIAGLPRGAVALKHEITEMALVQVPDSLKNIGITVMDGSFFSCMPFPARDAHSLSHVRYTPHGSWADEQELSPYTVLEQYPKKSKATAMLLDASRYVPCLATATITGLLWEVKTVLQKNEENDGRPIVFEKLELPFPAYNIIGGKIDNIYDVLERLEATV